jgi:hypothetical protein
MAMFSCRFPGRIHGVWQFFGKQDQIAGIEDCGQVAGHVNAAGANSHDMKAGLAQGMFLQVPAAADLGIVIDGDIEADESDKVRECIHSSFPVPALRYVAAT